MCAGPDEQEAWKDQVLDCLETVSKTDDYGAQVQALRRMRGLAEGVEHKLTSERFGNEGSRDAPFSPTTDGDSSGHYLHR